MTVPRTGPPLSAAWDRMRATAKAAASPPPAAPAGADDPLTDREREVLAFEGETWLLGGAKDSAIREQFGWSPTRYYQVLRGLLGRRAAVEHAPQLVARLRERVAGGRAGRGWL